MSATIERGRGRVAWALAIAVGLVRPSLSGLIGLLGCSAATDTPTDPAWTLRPIPTPTLAAITQTSGLALASVDGTTVLVVGTHAGLPSSFALGPDLRLEPSTPWSPEIEVVDHHATVVGDFDRDGGDDFYFVVGAHRGTADGANVLLLSSTRYRFDHATEFGVADPQGRGRGALVLDVDHDGRDELLVANFRTPLRAFTLEAGTLATDRADSMFALGAEHFVHTLVPADFDLDGYVDFVALGGPPVQVLRNLEGRVRADPGALPPEAFVPPPAAVAAGDFDGDGHPDLFFACGETDAVVEFDRPRRNRLLLWRAGRFEEIAAPDGAGVAAAAGDLDRDGHLDLVVAETERANGQARLRVFLGRGDGSFAEVTPPPDLQGELVGRPDGLLLHDLDGDGDLDLAVPLGAIEHGRPGGGVHLFRNDAAPRSWLAVEIGDSTPAVGQGARVSVRTGGQTQVRVMLPTQVGGSSSSLPLHFGLGDARRVDELRVEWADGQVVVQRDVAVDSRVRIERP